MKKFLTLAALAGAAFGITKMAALKKEWSDLTEAELRAKLDTKLAGKVPDATKRAEIGNKVVEGMRKKGKLRTDDATSATPSDEAIAATNGEATEG